MIKDTSLPIWQTLIAIFLDEWNLHADESFAQTERELIIRRH